MSAAEPESFPLAAWPAAARLIAQWLDRRERIDTLLDALPRHLPSAERARMQHLVLGVVRHFGRIDSALARLVSHAPRFSTRAILFIAGYELIEAAVADDSGRVAKIVHHAVEQTKALASPAEARLVNAVTRKLAAALAQPAPTLNVSAAELGAYFSHPEWLVQTWLTSFGPKSTRALLEWNLKPAPVYARWRAQGATMPAASVLKPTVWPGLYEVPSGQWSHIEPLLKAGKVYLQDPSTCIPVELLAPQPGDQVLDLCAAPGGKSLLIADTMLKSTAPDTTAVPLGRIVAVDLPGQRIDRLKENLSRVSGIEVALVQADALENLPMVLREHKLPGEYSAVLVDVPCSNTGVMRHRVDVKWRLQPTDIKKHSQQQLSLLHAAARLVATGGRLVYSTCSIAAEENDQVVQAFLASQAGGPFTLEKTVLSYPWTSGHDGGGAFLLRKSAS